MNISSNIKKFKVINEIINILDFDSRTNMPASGIAQRKEQINLLYDSLHDILESYSIEEIKNEMASAHTPEDRRNMELYTRATVQHCLVDNKLRRDIENLKNRDGNVMETG